MPSLAFPALGDVRADGYSLWTLGSKLSPWVTSRPAGLLPCLLSSLKMSSLDGGTCLVPGCQHRQARSAAGFSDACRVTWLRVGRRKDKRSWSLLLEYTSEKAGITRYLSSPITLHPPHSRACSLEGTEGCLPSQPLSSTGFPLPGPPPPTPWGKVQPGGGE